MKPSLTVAMLSLLVLAAAPAEGAVAWMRNTEPLAPSYTAPATSSHNPNGPVQVARTSPGLWQITFRGLGPAAANHNEQVTLAGGGPAFVCRVPRSFVNGIDLVVVVQCRTQTNVAANDQFFLLVNSK